MLSALPTYEIDNLYFCEDSINERQINREQIDIPVKSLSLSEQQQLIGNQDIVMAGPNSTCISSSIRAQLLSLKAEQDKMILLGDVCVLRSYDVA